MGSGSVASTMAGGRGTPLGTREKRFALSFGFTIESEIRCSKGLSRASSNICVSCVVCVCMYVCGVCVCMCVVCVCVCVVCVWCVCGVCVVCVCDMCGVCV